VGHGPVGALVSAWPALALVGSFELLMMLIRTGRGARTVKGESGPRYQPAPPLAHDARLELPVAPTLEQTVRARHEAGHSQRTIAREPTSTAAKSNEYSTKRHDSTERPRTQSRYVSAHTKISSAPYPQFGAAAGPWVLLIG
jgi:hypothetical protein